MFTGVCLSQGGACCRGGACSGGCLLQGVPSPRGACSGGFGGLVETPRTATAAGGTHPTGMHSCLYCQPFFCIVTNDNRKHTSLSSSANGP